MFDLLSLTVVFFMLGDIIVHFDDMNLLPDRIHSDREKNKMATL